MPLTILDQGSNNTVDIHDAVRDGSVGVVHLRGDGNSIVIRPGSLSLQANITLADHSSLTIGPDCRLAALEVVALSDGHVSIGANTSFNWHSRLYLHERGRIRIGERCLIASDTMLTVSDMHSLIDRRSGERINPSADVVIEDDVWLAHAVTVLKGVRVGRGSVVGIGSIVSQDVPEYCVAAGRPATVVRTNTSWDARLL